MSNSPSTDDFISDLPSNLIEKILVHLPLQDAVKTSVLSRQWRHKWLTLPQLLFHSNLVVKLITRHRFVSWSELFMTIYEVLLRHRGPIVNFSLSIPGLEEEDCPQINHLISFLSKKDIQEFTLYISWSLDHLTLSSNLFSCLQLRYLHLSFCVLNPPPTFNGFNKLINVVFREVTFAVDIFENFVSKCPLLERLTLKDCTNTDNIEIDAPNLKFLYFKGIFKSICLKNTPLLATVSFETSEYVAPEMDDEQIADMSGVFDCLPLIEYLSAGYLFLMYLAAGYVPERLLANLEYLITLVLDGIYFGVLEEVRIALCFIRSSPNLQKLRLRFELRDDEVDVEPVVEFLEAQEFLDISLNQLRQVEMEISDDIQPEKEFIKLLLIKSPLLETMHIWFKESNTTKVYRIINDVLRYHCASPIAEIIFLDSYGDCICKAMAFSEHETFQDGNDSE